MGVVDFVSEIKSVENYLTEKLSHEIKHGLQGLLVISIKAESMEANDLSHTLWKWV